MTSENDCTCVSVAQVRVMGAMMGAWGREKYGMKPIKKDALEYWPERLERLKEEIMKETTEAHDKTVPCAFVTFRRAAAPGQISYRMSFQANPLAGLLRGTGKHARLDTASPDAALQERHPEELGSFAADHRVGPVLPAFAAAVLGVAVTEMAYFSKVPK